MICAHDKSINAHGRSTKYNPTSEVMYTPRTSRTSSSSGLELPHLMNHNSSRHLVAPPSSRLYSSPAATLTAVAEETEQTARVGSPHHQQPEQQPPVREQQAAAAAVSWHKPELAIVDRRLRVGTVSRANPVFGQERPVSLCSESSEPPPPSEEQHGPAQRSRVPIYGESEPVRRFKGEQGLGVAALFETPLPTPPPATKPISRKPTLQEKPGGGAPAIIVRKETLRKPAALPEDVGYIEQELDEAAPGSGSSSSNNSSSSKIMTIPKMISLQRYSYTEDDDSRHNHNDSKNDLVYTDDTDDKNNSDNNDDDNDDNRHARLSSASSEAISCLDIDEYQQVPASPLPVLSYNTAPLARRPPKTASSIEGYVPVDPAGAQEQPLYAPMHHDTGSAPQVVVLSADDAYGSFPSSSNAAQPPEAAAYTFDINDGVDELPEEVPYVPLATGAAGTRPKLYTPLFSAGNSSQAALLPPVTRTEALPVQLANVSVQEIELFGDALHVDQL